MNTKEYDQKKQECWEEYFKHVVCGTDSHEYWFNKIFDCAFALGKEKETITQEEIEKAAKKYAAEVDKNVRDLYGIENLPVSLTFGECAAESFREGVSFALGKQEKDVVGEEMLTVPRKKVLYMYDFNEDILICDPTHNGAKLLKAKLQELFGSKCLPDEACNVASSDVAGSKSKPAEPKFKVGDKVRILSLHGSPTPDKGVVDVIAHINKGNRKQMYYLENHYHCAFGFQNPTSNPTPSRKRNILRANAKWSTTSSKTDSLKRDA